MKEAAHLLRFAGLFLVGFIVFMVVRQSLVPKDFGKYGHFRPGALDDVRAHPVTFAGRGTCEMCHEDQLKVLKTGKHIIVACEACHGPQSVHAEDPGKTKPVLPDTAKLCAQCHEANSGKPKKFPQVVSKEHSGGEVCKSCHSPHSPKIS